MKVLTFASMKGGVAKTSSAGYLAAALARLHPGRILAIDADPNNNLTDLLLRTIEEKTLEQINLLHVFTRKVHAADAVYHSTLVPGLDVIPSVPELAKVGAELFSNPMAVCLGFPAAIRKLPYDYVIIDAPPALTLEFRASLYAADHVVVPSMVHRWALQAYGLVRDELEEIEASGGRSPTLRILPSLSSAGQIRQLRELIGDVPFCLSSIPKMASIANATNAGTVLKPGSAAAVVFDDFAEEVMTWD